MTELPILLALVALFASVAVATGVLASTVLQRQSATQRRFDELLRRSPSASSGLPASTVLLTQGKRAPEYGKFLPKSPKEMMRLQRRLASAGIHGDSAAAIYVFAEIGLAVLAFVAVAGTFPTIRGMFFGAVAGFLGYMAPSLIVARRIALRKKEIQNGLPDALDLLIVCLEAGLGIDQALVKCAEEMDIAYPRLAEELRMINVEGRAGKPRVETFKNFAERTKVDDVRALVSMLVQTDRFGTSVAQALRTHADVSRTKRRQRAEERAAKIGVKLVFPLVFFLFPAFYVVTLGPAIIKFIHALAPGGALSGGQ
jgi:tight adherence protein C